MTNAHMPPDRERRRSNPPAALTRREEFGTLRARTWQWAFLRHLRHEVADLVPHDPSSVVSEAAAMVQQSYVSGRDGVPDRAGVHVLRASALVLGSYRALRSVGVSDAAAYEAVRRAFRATWRAPTMLLVRLFMGLVRDPVSALSHPRYQSVLRAVFGPGVDFQQLATDGQVDLVVTRCAFERFFATHEQPRLTQVVCEWDHNWMDVMSSSKRPIQLNRPTTLSTGCDQCTFQHIRTSTSGRPGRDVVCDQPSASRVAGDHGADT